MATRTFRGDAVPISQVTRITAPTVAGVVLLSINDKTMQFGSWDIATIVDTWNGETDPVHPVSETEEFSAVTASADGSDLILTADVPGVPFIVLALIGGDTLTSEQQTITIGNSPTGGTFTLTFGANTTAGIAYNAAAATVQTALEGLASIGAGNVVVTGNAGGPWLVKFQGALAATDLNLITANPASLTGGTATVTVTTLQNGATGVSEQQRINISGAPTGGTFTLTFSGQTTAPIAYNAAAATVQTALQALSTIGAGNATCTGGALPGTPVTVTFAGALANVNVPLLTSDGSALTGSTLSGSVTTTTPGVAGQNLIVEFTITGGGWYPKYNNGGGVIETSTIPIDSSYDASQVRTSLHNVPTFNNGAGALPPYTVDVTALGGGKFRVEFINALKVLNPVTTRVMAANLWFEQGGGAIVNTSNYQIATSGTNEVQQITIAGTPAAGTFTLTYSGQTTAPIAYNASAATVAAAINALSNVGGGLSGTGGPLPGSAVSITFAGNGFQATDVSQMTIDVTGLKVPITLLVDGVAGVQEIQRVTVNGSPFGGTLTLTLGAQTTAAIAWNAAAAAVQTALEGLGAIGAGNVTCTGGPFPGTPIVATFASSKGNLAQMTGTPTLHNGTVTIVETVKGGFLFSIVESTRSQGLNHWDDPTNWSPSGVPDSGDVVILDSGKTALLWGLCQRSTFTADATTDRLSLSTGRQTFLNGQKLRVRNAGGGLPAGLSIGVDYYVINAGVGGDRYLQLSTALGGSAVNITSAGTGTHTIEVVLAELRDGGRYTGLVGLPRETENDNFEYRSLYLQLGATLVTIGAGIGSGSGRFKLDTGGTQTAVKVLDTGGSVDPNSPAFVWKGSHASNTLEVMAGDVGVALFSGETATLASIIERGGTIELGAGVTVTGPIDKTGGILLSQQANIAGALLLRG